MFGKPKLIQHIFSFLVVLTLTLPLATHAAIKDTDVDGLTDQAEQEIYSTSPEEYDTDYDGISDGQEVLAGTNPLITEINQPKGLSSPETPLAWYIGRASGILAFILLTIVVVNGLLISTRLVSHFFPPALNYEVHRFVAWAALLATIGHFASFTFDKYLHLTWIEALIPFVLRRDFTSLLGINLSWSIGIGTLAFYMIATLIITSELKNKFISLKKWRSLHYMSFVAYLLFLGHGIFAGSDSTAWWMIWIYSLSGTLVLTLTATRIFLAIKKKPLIPRPLPKAVPPSVRPGV
ncbi:MAG: hypothetical protein AAB519_03010 [Patescibacteria group bacterium]